MGRGLIVAQAIGLVLMLGVVGGAAKADSCSSVVPGAQMGPSPNFNSWPWHNACYISWPGTDSRDYTRNPRLEYERKCRSVPGFIRFEGDYGSNRNTCIFTAPVTEAQTPPPVRDIAPRLPEPAASPAVNEQVADEQPSAVPTRSDPLANPDAFTLEKAHLLRGQLSAATSAMRAGRWQEAAQTFEQARKTASEIYSHDLYRGADSPVQDPEHAQEEILYCVSGIVTATAMYDRYQQPRPDDALSDTNCKDHLGDRLVREASEKYFTMKETRLAEDKAARAAKQAAAAPIAASCIEIVQSRKVSSACDFKGGVPMYRNEIRIPPAAAHECPADVQYQLVEPQTGTTMRGYASRRSSFVDTCGGPATGLRTRP